MPTLAPPKRAKSLLQHRREIEKRRQKRRRKRKRVEENPTVEDDQAIDVGGHDEASSYTGVPPAPVQPSRQGKRPKKTTRKPTESDLLTTLIAKPRRKVARKKKKSRESNPKQQLTELSAVGHILADEVHMFLNPQSSNQEAKSNSVLTSGEERQLTAWVDAVQKQIYTQSRVVSENVLLVSQLKESSTRIRRLRDDLMVLRTQTRIFQQEGDDLEKQLLHSQQDLSARRGASRFLTALENLAIACKQKDPTSSAAAQRA